jgi:glycosyltransferase involved in cell wall biosynthesis
LRVVHLGKYYPPASGGIETFTRTLARAQADLGADVRVVVVNHADATGRDVTFEPAARTPDRTDADGPVRVLRAGRVANVAKLDVPPGLLRLLHRELRDPPDVWHLHTPNVTMLLALAVMPRVRPLVVTHHSDIVRQRVLRYGVAPFEHLIYRRAARIMPTSDPYVEGSPLLRRYRAKVTAVPLGLDLAPYTNPSPEARAYADTARRTFPGPIWLSVGRLIYYKALDVALRALRDVPGTLVVVGTGPMESAWKQLAAELGVADRVAWKGQTPDHELVGLYHAAAALWFPSNARSEGYGLVQVEAMACGCPVVNAAIPHSGVPWVCRDGEAGLTVPINDPPAFAAAAKRLLSEPGLREKLSAEAKRQAVERFDHRKMAEQTLKIYAEVVGA